MLDERTLREEQMDSPLLDQGTYARVLADLARVNWWTMTARPVLDFLARAVGERRAFSLLDVGFGHGDTLRAVARWARKRGLSARLVGVDLNPASQAIAQAATPPGLAIDYRTGDYRDQPERFDFIISSQVAHHMSAGQLRDFLRHMEGEAAAGWLVVDLHRHGFAHAGFPLLARLIGVHRIVREDGQLSIARSFRPEEWPEVLADAGLPLADLRIARAFPFRIAVERIRRPAQPPGPDFRAGATG